MTEQEFINAKDLGVLDSVSSMLSSICVENQPSIDNEEFRDVVAKIAGWQIAIRSTIEIKQE